MTLLAEDSLGAFVAQFWDYYRWTLLAGALLAVGLGYLGGMVVRRKIIFVDLAQAQIAALGGILAALYGLSHGHGEGSTAVLVLTFGCVALGSAIFTITRPHDPRVPHEALIGIVYIVAAALGILLVTRLPGGAEHFQESLVGNMDLLHAAEDETIPPRLWPLVLVFGALAAFHLVFRRHFHALGRSGEDEPRDGEPQPPNTPKPPKGMRIADCGTGKEQIHRSRDAEGAEHIPQVSTPPTSSLAIGPQRTQSTQKGSEVSFSVPSAPSVDPSGSPASGPRPPASRLWDFAFFLSIGLAVTVSIQIAGVLLLFSYLIIPAIAALLIGRTVAERAVVLLGVSVLATVGGLALSLRFDFPGGPAIVTVFAALLLFVGVVRYVALAKKRSRSILQVGAGLSLLVGGAWGADALLWELGHEGSEHAAHDDESPRAVPWPESPTSNPRAPDGAWWSDPERALTFLGNSTCEAIEGSLSDALEDGRLDAYELLEELAPVWVERGEPRALSAFVALFQHAAGDYARQQALSRLESLTDQRFEGDPSAVAASWRGFLATRAHMLRWDAQRGLFIERPKASD